MSAASASAALAAAVDTSRPSPTRQRGAQGRTCGTRGGYAGGCRCQPCRDATAAYSRNRYRLVAYGQWTGKQPIEPSRQKLLAWREEGHTMRALAAATGLAEKVLDDVLRGRPTGMVHGSTAQAIANARPQLTPTSRVPSTGSVRRLQALMRLGWPLVDIAAASGVSDGLLGQLVNGGRPRTYLRTAQAITTAYDRLWDAKPPAGQPSVLARRRAEDRNWPPPVAWDDDSIDDPEAEPQGVALGDIRARLANDPAVIDEVRLLLASDYSDQQIAYRVGLTASGVQKLRTRHNLRRSA